jgi:hypothetical protein
MASCSLKMVTKKLFITIILGMFLIGFISAVEVSYCCEKTTDGAWCQNAPLNECSSSFRKVPTSCEATSYCKLGCCYDSQEGTCDENTPQKVCEDNNGVWEGNAECDITACNLGCCLIGDQASFVTQTRCKRLASVYGLEIDFRTDLADEVSCIASATSDAKGACVIEEEYTTTCVFTTKKDCAEMTGTNASGTAEFHEDYLCSAEELETVCGPTEKTTCVEGRDEVFFVDSCGNLANIYDSSKINDKNYWTKIYGKQESCSYGKSNADSRTCGNCDYYLGSSCKKAKISQNPSYGNNICADLSCEFEGEEYQHGESWCADSKGVSKNLPGSRYFRMVCYNGEVTVEPCADYRQETCIQSDIDGFKFAACRVNEWQDCSAYSWNGTGTVKDAKKDCENEEKRDCVWLDSLNKCLPKNAPGFDLSGNSTESNSFCSLATTTCVVKYEKNLLGKKKCVENCDCLGAAWLSNQKGLCTALGDCGVKTNYLGVKGYNDWD